MDGDSDGLTACDGDCDDTDPEAWPGAPERCNGRDDDCNGLIDDGADCRIVDDLPADGEGWSDTEITTVTVDGELVDVHGMWGNMPSVVEKTWRLDDMPHAEVEIAFRYYAIDSWDTESASLLVDGITVFSETRVYHSPGTGDDWVTVGSFTPAPWGAAVQGYWDKVLVIPHTADAITLSFQTGINQGESDESWGFSHLRVTLL